VAKVTRCLIPFLVACFFVAYLDRVNIGFAALSMNAALGFSSVVFGWGAGIFFIGYCLLEAPSNYVMERVGARRWIARIMVSWGIVAALMAIVWSETSFFVLRFLLGAAEAGFAPGVILYLTYWIPARYRARSLGAFLIALPLSSMVGAPILGLVLATMDGVAGVSAWRWLFVIEAAPAVLLGIAAYFYLTDKPENAAWLAPRERALLQDLLDGRIFIRPACSRRRSARFRNPCDPPGPEGKKRWATEFRTVIGPFRAPARRSPVRRRTHNPAALVRLTLNRSRLR
jgi:ACS family tartrate transporter-like MFS transporter